MRVVTVEQGVDPRELALVAFGGAGPLHACAVADALGMRAVIVPPRAGVFSAVGLAVRAAPAGARAVVVGRGGSRRCRRTRSGRARTGARPRRRGRSTHGAVDVECVTRLPVRGAEPRARRSRIARTPVDRPGSRSTTCTTRATASRGAATPVEVVALRVRAVAARRRSTSATSRPSTASVVVGPGGRRRGRLHGLGPRRLDRASPARRAPGC